MRQHGDAPILRVLDHVWHSAAKTIRRRPAEDRTGIVEILRVFVAWMRGAATQHPGPPSRVRPRTSLLPPCLGVSTLPGKTGNTEQQRTTEGTPHPTPARRAAYDLGFSLLPPYLGVSTLPPCRIDGNTEQQSTTEGTPHPTPARRAAYDLGSLCFLRASVFLPSLPCRIMETQSNRAPRRGHRIQRRPAEPRTTSVRSASSVPRCFYPPLLAGEGKLEVISIAGDFDGELRIGVVLTGNHLNILVNHDAHAGIGLDLLTRGLIRGEGHPVFSRQERAENRPPATTADTVLKLGSLLSGRNMARPSASGAPSSVTAPLTWHSVSLVQPVLRSKVHTTRPK